MFAAKFLFFLGIAVAFASAADEGSRTKKDVFRQYNDGRSTANPSTYGRQASLRWRYPASYGAYPTTYGRQYVTSYGREYPTSYSNSYRNQYPVTYGMQNPNAYSSSYRSQYPETYGMQNPTSYSNSYRSQYPVAYPTTTADYNALSEANDYYTQENQYLNNYPTNQYQNYMY